MEQLNELVASIINLPADSLTPESGPESHAEWDSLAHIGIIAAVEQTYNVQFAMPEILGIKNMVDIRATLAKHNVTLTD